MLFHWLEASSSVFAVLQHEVPYWWIIIIKLLILCYLGCRNIENSIFIYIIYYQASTEQHLTLKQF